MIKLLAEKERCGEEGMHRAFDGKDGIKESF